jgi:hypothetical protein
MNVSTSLVRATGHAGRMCTVPVTWKPHSVESVNLLRGRRGFSSSSETHSGMGTICCVELRWDALGSLAYCKYYWNRYITRCTGLTSAHMSAAEAKKSLLDFAMLIPSLTCGALAVWQVDRMQTKVSTLRTAHAYP